MPAAPGRARSKARLLEMTAPETSQKVEILCADGVVLGGNFWRPAGEPEAVVVINAATGVLARYYHRYARWLADAGFAVLTYDYRGIGASRPPDVRTCGYRWQDWGECDFPAAAALAQRMAPGVRLQVVGHSFGGFIPGMSAAGTDVERILTVGAQYACWRDYLASARARLFLKWHVAMPFLSMIFGFFPGRYLNWLEDLPKGVALQWASVGRRWESRIAPDERARLLQRFEAVSAPILAIVLSDDELATPASVDRGLAYYRCSTRTRTVIRPSDFDQLSIGHFGFFHDRNRAVLWPVTTAWLRDGRIPNSGSTSVVTPALDASELEL